MLLKQLILEKTLGLPEIFEFFNGGGKFLCDKKHFHITLILKIESVQVEITRSLACVQTSPSPIFSEEAGTSVHRLQGVKNKK